MRDQIGLADIAVRIGPANGERAFRDAQSAGAERKNEGQDRVSRQGYKDILGTSSGESILKRHTIAAACLSAVSSLALVAGLSAGAPQTPAGAAAPQQPPPGGRGRGRGPVADRHARRWARGISAGRGVRIHVSALQGPRSSVGHRILARRQHARDGTARASARGSKRRARSDADRPAASDAGDRPRRHARRRAPSAVCRESSDLSHLLEARRRTGQRDDRRVSRALGRRLDAGRRQGHPRRQRVLGRTRHGPDARARERQLRLARSRSTGPGCSTFHSAIAITVRRRRTRPRTSGRSCGSRTMARVPPDNPFVGKAGYLPEIYTLGHRNPLGLAFNPMPTASSGPRRKVRRAATS